MNTIVTFFRDETGAVTTEFVTLVPAFVLLLVFFTDASIVYLTRSEMWTVARDTARRMSTDQISSASQARNYAASRLFLGARTYGIYTDFSADRKVTIAIPIADAAIFGAFMEPVLGRTMAVSVTMRAEPLLG